MAYLNWFYFCPIDAPIAMSNASVDMWNVNDQFGPLRMGATNNFSFSFLNAF